MLLSTILSGLFSYLEGMEEKLKNWYNGVSRENFDILCKHHLKVDENKVSTNVHKTGGVPIIAS